MTGRPGRAWVRNSNPDSRLRREAILPPSRGTTVTAIRSVFSVIGVVCTDSSFIDFIGFPRLYPVLVEPSRARGPGLDNNACTDLFQRSTLGFGDEESDEHRPQKADDSVFGEGAPG